MSQANQPLIADPPAVSTVAGGEPAVQTAEEAPDADMPEAAASTPRLRTVRQRRGEPAPTIDALVWCLRCQQHSVTSDGRLWQPTCPSQTYSPAIT